MGHACRNGSQGSVLASMLPVFGVHVSVNTHCKHSQTWFAVHTCASLPPRLNAAHCCVCGNVQDMAELTEAARKQLAAVVKTHAASISPASILPLPLPFTPPFLSLPATATQALQGLLPRWASVRTFEQAMRFQSLDKAQLQAILTAAENICQAAARKTPLVRSDTQHHAAATASPAAADTKDEPEADLVGNSTLAGISDGMFMDLDERLGQPARWGTPCRGRPAG